MSIKKVIVTYAVEYKTVIEINIPDEIPFIRHDDILDCNEDIESWINPPQNMDNALVSDSVQIIAFDLTNKNLPCETKNQ